MSIKNPLTPVGIEPATFRFLAQHLNHCATAVPHTCLMQVLNFHTCPAVGCKKFYNTATQTFDIASKFLSKLCVLGLTFERQDFIITAALWDMEPCTRNLLQIYGHFVKIYRLSRTFIFCPGSWGQQVLPKCQIISSRFHPFNAKTALLSTVICILRK
jgi:hypothetical protein